jgi:predicted DNA-binding transcriptional regulator AlpA
MPRILIPRACLPERYGVTRSTIARWLRDRAVAFPNPVVIKGRAYFDEDELVAWEDAHRERLDVSPVVDKPDPIAIDQLDMFR